MRNGRPHPTTKLRPLELALFQQRPLIHDDLLGKQHRVVVAVSGGVDSVALLRVLVRLRTRWGMYLEAAYVHHGLADRPASVRYRNRAEKLVQKVAGELEVPFVSLRADTQVLRQSEDALREARHAKLTEYAKSGAFDLVAMGHHRDDLFETRLIRLIRGTGPQGLKAMSVRSGLLWRPFLPHSRLELEKYLADGWLRRGKDWLEDPSNRDARYLRNALRRRLIPQIEKLRSGGVEAMARSFEIIAQAVDEADDESQSEASLAAPLDRAGLLGLTPAGRRLRLSKWLRKNNVRNISASHIEEILKRIDTPRKRLTFKTAGRVWVVDQTISVSSEF